MEDMVKTAGGLLEGLGTTMTGVEEEMVEPSAELEEVVVAAVEEEVVAEAEVAEAEVAVEAEAAAVVEGVDPKSIQILL